MTLRWIGGIAILGILAVLVVFYLWRGMVRIESGRSGRTIVRFNAFERFVHWMTATCFIILALSGLNITFGRPLLLPLMSPEAFTAWSEWAKYAHNYLSFPFTLGVILIFFMWIAGNIPNRVDVEWFKRGGGIVGHDHPPAYRFNGGQKMIYWIVVLGGSRGGDERLCADVPVLRHRYRRPCRPPQIAHGIIAMLFVAAMLGHIYIGTIGMEGAFEAMGDGTVDSTGPRNTIACGLKRKRRAPTRRGAAQAGRHGCRITLRVRNAVNRSLVESVMSTTASAVSAHGAHDHPTGWRRYLYSTNHKDIGTMYLVFAIGAGLIGGAFSILIRMELQDPGLQIFTNPHYFNVVVSAHGLIMIFFMLMPAMIGGFGNWMVPLMIGAPDMAFPRMNNISFWLLPASFTLFLISMFVEGRARLERRWHRLDALSTAIDRRTSRPGRRFCDLVDPSCRCIVDPWRDQFHHHHFQHARAGHDLHQMPLFAWSILVTAFMLLFSLPVLAGAITMAAHRSQLRNDLFQSGRRRRPDPLSTPVLVLRPSRSLHHDPAGLRHHQPCRFDVRRKPIFGYLGMVYAMVAISVHRLHRLGTSYVHGWSVGRRPGLLRHLEHGDRGTDRHQDLFLDRDHVGRLD